MVMVMTGTSVVLRTWHWHDLDPFPSHRHCPANLHYFKEQQIYHFYEWKQERLNLCSLENSDESLSHENRCKLFKIKVHKCNICIKENLPLRIFQQAFCCLILKQSLYEDCLVIVVELRYQCGSQAPLKYCQLLVFVTDLCGIWFGILAFRSWFSHNSRWRSLLLIALELRYQ